MDFETKLGQPQTIKRIVGCTHCNCSGVITKEEMIDYHKRDYEHWNIICDKCNGEGRVLEIDFNVRVEITFPNGDRTSKNINSMQIEPLNGRKTEDIYKIGR